MEYSAPYILIDQAHNEDAVSIPADFLPEFNLIFNKNGQSDVLDDLEGLKKYKLILFINPKPISREKSLFLPYEIKTLKKYVKSGGRILLTSSAGGNGGLAKRRGSIDALWRITGVKRFPPVMIFHQDERFYENSRRNLKLCAKHLMHGEFFASFGRNECIYTGLKGSTYLIPIYTDDALSNINDEKEQDLIGAEDDLPEIEVILSTPLKTAARDLIKKRNYYIHKKPIIIAGKLGKGKVLSCAFSEFLKESSFGGYNSPSGRKLLSRIFSYLLL